MKLQFKIYTQNTLLNATGMATFVLASVRWSRNSLLAFVNNHLIDYPTLINLTYAWSFNFSAGMCLVIQMLSGIFLAKDCIVYDKN